MNRNELYSADRVDKLELRLAWASLEIFRSELDQIQVAVSGAQTDVDDLRMLVRDRMMIVEQPNYGISHHIGADHWMQVVIRIPQNWKGAMNASTTTGSIRVRGFTGTDVLLDSMTGDIKAEELQTISLTLRSVNGKLFGSSLEGEKLSVRNISGTVVLDGCRFDSYKTSNVSGQQTLMLERAFENFDLNTVSGDVSIIAPVSQAEIIFRTVNGRIRTNGVDLVEGAALVKATSVSGSLEIASTSIN